MKNLWVKFRIKGSPVVALDTDTPPVPVALPALSETKIRRLDDNVLTLDYVDVKVGGEERKDIYVWQANKFIFQKHGFSSGNPWDNQVQFKDELIKKKFPPNSGFEATYHFNLQQSIPKNLSVVIECPDLYKIFCNDVEVKAEPNEWRFDRAFGKINLSKTAKIGENKIQIVASPMTMEHELEPAYLLGDFSLEPAGKGFVVVSPKPLTLNPGGDADLPQLGWNRQGMPFYADKVEYSRKFNVQKTSAAKRCFVKFDDWYGATAQITVNNKHAGYVVSAPWQIDVTEILEEGENEIAVIVYGTPKNLFGPHHCGQLRGQAWPRHFQSAPEHQPNGTAYDTIGYGLFAPFELIAK